MRITDCRYDRDRLRLAVAYRLISHEARTQTIRAATGLSGDRIRKLYRDYVRGQPVRPVRRRRGKSPRQMTFFRRSPAMELQAATLGALLHRSGLLENPPRPYGPELEKIDRFCDVYETFRVLWPDSPITIEHALYLLQVLARMDEFVLTRCRDCEALWVRDTLDLLPDNCATCRNGLPSE